MIFGVVVPAETIPKDSLPSSDEQYHSPFSIILTERIVSSEAVSLLNVLITSSVHLVLICSLAAVASILASSKIASVLYNSSVTALCNSRSFCLFHWNQEVKMPIIKKSIASNRGITLSFRSIIYSFGKRGEFFKS